MMEDEKKRNNSSLCCDKIEELIQEYRKRLKQSRLNAQGFTEHEAGFTDGKETIIEELIEKLEEILYD